MHRRLLRLTVLGLLAWGGGGCSTSEPRGPDGGVPIAPDAHAIDAGDASAALPALTVCGALGTGRTMAGALSPDGTIWAYAELDDVRIVDAATGAYVRTIDAGFSVPAEAYALGFSPDGSRLRIVTSAGTRVLSATDGSLLVDLPREVMSPDGVEGAAIASDADVAAIEAERQIHVLNLATGADRTVSPPIVWTHNLALSPDGTILAVAQGDSIVLVSVADGTILRTLPIAAEVYSDPIRFSPDGTLVAVAHRPPDDAAETVLLEVARVDGTGAVAALRDRAPRLAIFAAVWSRDGAHIHVARDDGEIVDAAVTTDASGALQLAVAHRVPMPLDDAYELAIDAAGHYFGGSRHAWSIDADGSFRWMSAGQFDGAERYPLGLDGEGAALLEGALWDLSTGLVRRRLGRPGVTALSRDGRVRAWASSGTVFVESDEAPIQFSAPIDAIGGLAVDDDAVTLASDTRIAVMDRRTGAVLALYPIAPGGNRDGQPLVARSPDGRFALVAGYSAIPHLIDLSSGRSVGADALGLGEVVGVSAATFLHDGRIARASRRDQPLRIVDVAGTGFVEVATSLQPDAVVEVGDARLLVSSSEGLTLLDETSFDRSPALSLDPVPAWITALAVSPDTTRALHLADGRATILCLSP